MGDAVDTEVTNGCWSKRYPEAGRDERHQGCSLGDLLDELGNESGLLAGQAWARKTDDGGQNLE